MIGFERALGELSDGSRRGRPARKRDRLYLAAPPSGALGARSLVFEAQTD